MTTSSSSALRRCSALPCLDRFSPSTDQNLRCRLLRCYSDFPSPVAVDQYYVRLPKLYYTCCGNQTVTASPAKCQPRRTTADCLQALPAVHSGSSCTKTLTAQVMRDDCLYIYYGPENPSISWQMNDSMSCSVRRSSPAQLHQAGYSTALAFGNWNDLTNLMASKFLNLLMRLRFPKLLTATRYSCKNRTGTLDSSDDPAGQPSLIRW
jgi:hypothetical protein